MMYVWYGILLSHLYILYTTNGVLPADGCGVLVVPATTMHYQLRAQETNGVTVGVCGILLHTYHPLPTVCWYGA
jgi:hypothetical protein